MQHVGLDFDNTLACYDEVFPEVAADLGLVAGSWHGTKQQLRDLVRNLPNGEEMWQRIQGRVYGRYMHRAVLFPGAAEFLLRCRTRGIKVSIVSHKTLFGHFDPDKIPLRDAAIRWMDQNGFFSSAQFDLRREDVCFADTREEKLQQIRDRGCEIFVDDLVEVLAEPEFPGDVKKILYSPGAQQKVAPDIQTCASWKEIGQELFEAPLAAEVLDTLALRFPALKVSSVVLEKGRGNSRIYKLTDQGGTSYALKAYPDLQRDSRPRREIEFASLALCHEADLPVPRPVMMDSAMNWGIYEWIDAAQGVESSGEFIDAAIRFAAQLRTQAFEQRANWEALASEACLCGSELERQIRGRFAALEAINDVSLRDFLIQELAPIIDALFDEARADWPQGYDVEIPTDCRTLSPSDFGSHNAIAIRGGETVFIDFEYFGWDDPVKLMADFFWHPAMELTNHHRARWLDGCRRIFADDTNLEARLKLALPLYGVRWCLIVLNEFKQTEWEKRLGADADRRGERCRILGEQLAKARRLLERVKMSHEWAR